MTLVLNRLSPPCYDDLKKTNKPHNELHGCIKTLYRAGYFRLKLNASCQAV